MIREAHVTPHIVTPNLHLSSGALNEMKTKENKKMVQGQGYSGIDIPTYQKSKGSRQPKHIPGIPKAPPSPDSCPQDSGDSSCWESDTEEPQRSASGSILSSVFSNTSCFRLSQTFSSTTSYDSYTRNGISSLSSIGTGSYNFNGSISEIPSFGEVVGFSSICYPAVRPLSSNPAGGVNLSRNNDSQNSLETLIGKEAIHILPTRNVDYLCHDWSAKDAWASWSYIRSSRDVHDENTRGRLENAVWRALEKSRLGLKTVPPESVNWLKSFDVTWLYGPFQHRAEEDLPITSASESFARPCISWNNILLHPYRRPILRRRIVSEMMLRRSLSASTLLREAVAAVHDTNSKKSKSLLSNPQHPLLALPTVNPTVRALATSSGLVPPEYSKKLKVRFDERVEQFIAFDGDSDDDLPLYYDHSDADDGVLMMKRSNSAKKWPSLSKRRKAKPRFDANGKMIVILPPTKIRDEDDSARLSDIDQTTVDSRDDTLSSTESLITLQPSYPATRIFLGEDRTQRERWSSESLQKDAEGSAVDEVKTSLVPVVHYSIVRRALSEMLMSSDKDNNNQRSVELMGRLIDGTSITGDASIQVTDADKKDLPANNSSTSISVPPTTRAEEMGEGSNLFETEDLSPQSREATSLAVQRGSCNLVEPGEQFMPRYEPEFGSSSASREKTIGTAKLTALSDFGKVDEVQSLVNLSSLDANIINTDVEECEVGTEYTSSESGSTESSDSVYRDLSNLAKGDLDSPQQIMESILNPAQHAMAERVMEEFWAIFQDRNWDMSFRECTGTSSSSSSGPQESSTTSTAHTFSLVGPRKRQRQEKEPPDDGQGQDPRKPVKPTGWENVREDSFRFACPYRKHDPRRYNVYSHSVCSISHWGMIARVKEHLYRSHRMTIHCKRCWGVFKTQEQLDAHVRVAVSSVCELQDGLPPEGITPEQERRLRSRKKASPNQTDEDRWKDIYRLLFPNEQVPSPYFVPLQEERSMSPDSRDLANYEDYIRRELPRLVRSQIEETLRREMQPFEGSLVGNLVGIIQDCQDRVFRAYRETQSSSDGIQLPSNIDGGISPNQVNSDSTDEMHNMGRLESHPQTQPGFLDTIFQAPPDHRSEASFSLPDDDALRTLIRPTNDIMLSDSGYGSGQQFCACPDPCDCNIILSGFQNRDVDSVNTVSQGTGGGNIEWHDWDSYNALQ